jgi:CheY-like chemotaxis protein
MQEEWYMPNETIAVVNDDTTFLELMHDLLEDAGYGVYIWKEGASAFDNIKDKMPNLLVLDIRIDQPEGGLGVLELMVLDPETSKIPIIVCSADIRALEAQEENYRLHGIRSLAKPFDLDELLKMVEEALAQSQQP